VIAVTLEVRVLAYEVLKQLQETESSADDTIREAEERARGILRDARASARALMEKAMAEAVAEGKSIIEAESAKAQAEATEMLKRNDELCRKLRDKARANIPRAVDLIVERVVTSSGNR